jgi:hypothetical protein
LGSGEGKALWCEEDKAFGSEERKALDSEEGKVLGSEEGKALVSGEGKALGSEKGEALRSGLQWILQQRKEVPQGLYSVMEECWYSYLGGGGGGCTRRMENIVEFD